MFKDQAAPQGFGEISYEGWQQNPPCGAAKY